MRLAADEMFLNPKLWRLTALDWSCCLCLAAILTFGLVVHRFVVLELLSAALLFSVGFVILAVTAGAMALLFAIVSFALHWTLQRAEAQPSRLRRAPTRSAGGNPSGIRTHPIK